MRAAKTGDSRCGYPRDVYPLRSLIAEVEESTRLVRRGRRAEQHDLRAFLDTLIVGGTGSEFEQGQQSVLGELRAWMRGRHVD